MLRLDDPVQDADTGIGNIKNLALGRQSQTAPGADRFAQTLDRNGSTLADREESVVGLYGSLYGDLPTGEEKDFTSNKEKLTLGLTVGIEQGFRARRTQFDPCS